MVNEFLKKYKAAKKKVRKLDDMLHAARNQLELAQLAYSNSVSNQAVESLKGLKWTVADDDYRPRGMWGAERWIAPLPPKHFLREFSESLGDANTNRSYYRFKFSYRQGGQDCKATIDISLQIIHRKLRVLAPTRVLKDRLGQVLDVDPKKEQTKLRKLIKDVKLTTEEIEDVLKRRKR